MPRSRARLGLVVLGLAVSILFGYLAIRNVRWDDTWDALRATNYWWLLPAVLALGVSIGLKALRWQHLFGIGRRPPLVPVTVSLLVGSFVNNVLPARAGEAARVVALRATARVSAVEGAGTVVAERVLDVLVLLAMLFVAAPFVPSVGWIAAAAAFAGLALVGTAIFVAVLATFGSRPFLWAARLIGQIPRVPQAPLEHAAENLVLGLALFRHPRIAVTVVPLTVASWLSMAACFWFVMIGFDLETGFAASILIVVATNLVLVLPSSPAALGVFEAATIVALSPFGIEDSEALSYALVSHVVNVIPVLVVGYIALHWMSIHVARSPERPRRKELAAPSR